MSITQPIDLVVWVGPGRDHSPILQHTKIETPGGEITLRANLVLYMAPADVPKEPGLYLVKADAQVVKRPGYGTDCRLIFRKAKQVAGDLAELVRGHAIHWDQNGDPVADPHSYASDAIMAPGEVFELFRGWHNGPRFFLVVETTTGIEVEGIGRDEFEQRSNAKKGAA